MSTQCNRCDGTGFRNIHQVEDISPQTFELFEAFGEHAIILEWIVAHEDHDVAVCDCCGDGEEWYGTPGEHYNSNDPMGEYGPYAYNGGLCECH